jgi:pilus assembly protein Flp/PilA
MMRSSRHITHQEKRMLGKFLKDESGATAIEYGLIAALVAIACIAALEAMGTSLKDMFTGVKTKLDQAKTKMN